MFQHQRDIQCERGQTSGKKNAAGANENFICRNNSSARDGEAGEKCDVARDLQSFGIQISQRGNLRAANVFAVSREPDEKRNDFVKHSNDRERNHTNQTEEAVTTFKLAAESI